MKYEDMLIEAFKIIEENKKILILGEVGRGKTFFVDKMQEYLEEKDFTYMTYNERTILPSQILEQNIFMDVMFNSLIFDCGNHIREITTQKNKAFSVIRKCACSVMVTGCVLQHEMDMILRSPYLAMIFNSIIEVKPNREYSLHHIS